MFPDLVIGGLDRVFLYLGIVGLVLVVTLNVHARRHYGRGWWLRCWAPESTEPGCGHTFFIVLVFVFMVFGIVGAIIVATHTNDDQDRAQLQKAYPNRVIMSVKDSQVTFVNDQDPADPNDDVICEAKWSSRGGIVAIYRPTCEPVEPRPAKKGK